MSRRIVVMVGAACAVLLLAWFVLLWSPKGSDLDAARQRRTAAEGRMHELEVRLAQLQEAEGRIGTLEQSAERLRLAVPDQADLPGFISAVNLAATSTQVEFVSVVPSLPAASTTVIGASEIPVSINARGGYFRMLDFLDLVLGMDRILVADSFDLRGQAEGAEVTISITGRLFTTATPPDPTLGTVAPVPGATSTPTATPTPTPSPTPTEGIVLQ